MQFQNNFDFGEFLAYLLPGALLLLAFNQIFGAEIQATFVSEQVLLQQYGAVLGIIFYVAVSIAAGHLCSLWTRWIVRPLTRLLFGNPRTSILKQSSRFYTAPLRERIAQKFTQLFGLDMTDRAVRHATPRLIRAYALNKLPATLMFRDRHVRARGLCGNLSAPLLIFAALFYVGHHAEMFVISVLAVVALIFKQRDLDVREWKEVYLGFLTT